MANRVGQQLGNYKLEKLLGEGGFAEVYLGEHITLKQKRAIKVLRTALTEQEGLGFRIEAQRLASLTHPHIIPILDFDEREGFPYLVMSYAPNGSLRDRHPKGTRIPLSTVIEYVKQIGSALQYIHNQKLIHRDVKPENMLLGPDNTILLSDVGIAVVAHSEYSQRTQIATGTPYYMAPEQFRGKAEPSSDQYSLGVIVYEWLSGTRLFEGDSLQLYIQHAMEPPPLLREQLQTISTDIEKVVMTALAKKPQERFRSVQAFAIALEQAHGAELLPITILSSLSASLVPPSPMSQQAIPDRIEQSARFTLLSEYGEEIRTYSFDKPEISIGRAPNCDILLPKNKLTSRRHATVRYENGDYYLRDEVSVSNTFVNGRQIETLTPLLLHDGDHIGIGEHELVFRVFGSIDA